MAAPLRRSALHHRLVAAGARMWPAGDWEQAHSFDGEPGDALALGSGIVLADASAQHLLLAEARDLAAWLPSAPPVGEVALVANSGSPVRCCRLTADSALFVSASPLVISPAPEACCHATDLTSGRTIVVVAGPRSPDLLRAVTQLDLRDRALPDHHCAQTSVARVPAAIIRFDRSAARSYEILVARDLGEYLWDALLDSGAPLGARPVGMALLQRRD